MSITRNFHCDMCDSHWDHQTYGAPDELVGVTGDYGMTLVSADSPKAYKHVCKKCLCKVAEQVRELSSISYDFSKIK